MTECLDESEDQDLSNFQAHYDKKEGQYGFNRSTIVYPLYADKNQAIIRRSPDFSFPSELVTKFDQGKM